MVPATLAALYELATEAVAEYNARPDADPDYPVRPWYGPVVTGDPADSVFIGYDGDPDGDMEAVASDEDWAGIGAKRRDERFTVRCAIVVLVGTAVPLDAIERVYAILAIIAHRLRVDPSLGLGPPRSPVYYAEIASVAVHNDQTSRGIQTRMVFGVRVRTRT